MLYIFSLFFIFTFSTLHKIHFVGVRNFKEKDLVKILGLRKGAPYSTPLLKSSLIRLEGIYRKKGFFDFRVDSIKEVRKDENIDVFIYVTEGKRRIVSDVLYMGMEHFTMKEIRKAVDLSVPFPYDEDLLNDAESKIIEKYTESGFPFVDVSLKREEKNYDTLKIIFEIREGPRVYIRNIALKGYKKVRRKILEREITVKKGDLYMSSKIFESTRRLYSTGLFKSVRYELHIIKGVEDSIDVTFFVKEVKPGYINTGFGYHSPEEFQLRGGVGHLNVFNNGQRAELRSDLLFTLKDLKRERFELYYSEPYLLGFRMEGRIHPFYELDRMRSIREYGFDIQFNKLLGPYLKLTYAIEWKNVKGEVVEGVYINTNVLQAVWDSRSPLMDPRRGLFALNRFEIAGGPLGGQYDFLRWVYDNSFYTQLGKNVIAARLRLGYQKPYGRSTSIPPEEQFTLGGEGTLRGYDFHSVGVYVEKVGYYVGNVLYLFNFEWRGRFIGNWGYVIFFDYGGLFSKLSELSLFRDAAISGGIGIRYRTPFGPLRLDWGIKLKNRGKKDRGRVYIGIGHMF